MKAKGGQDSLYAVDYAARVACEIGADVVKLNVPNSEEAERRFAQTLQHDGDGRAGRVCAKS